MTCNVRQPPAAAGGARRALLPAVEIEMKEASMSDSTQTGDTTNEIPREILELAEVLESLPEEYRQTVSPLLVRVIDSNRRRRRILSLVQEALGQLRLDMKYLAFDLEATRRERDEFRRKLEGSV
jgi:hypothetical protein